MLVQGERSPASRADSRLLRGTDIADLRRDVLVVNAITLLRPHGPAVEHTGMVQGGFEEPPSFDLVFTSAFFLPKADEIRVVQFGRTDTPHQTAHSASRDSLV